MGEYEPTEHEQRVIAGVAVANAVLSLLAIVFTNVTGSWWWLAGFFLIALVAVVGVTVWISRNHRMSVVELARKVLRKT